MTVSRSTKLATTVMAALAGGAYWAGVRPSGYGSGPSMGLLWGLTWLVLVYFLHPGSKFPPRPVHLMLAFVIGFSIGGTQGYGQFNQWVQGMFHLDIENTISLPISPAVGLIHLFICGLTWGGFPALLISWVLVGKNSPRAWAWRAIVGIWGYLIVQMLILVVPQAFLPYHDAGYYVDFATCVDCQRTIETARNTWGYLGSFLAMSLHAAWKDPATRAIFPRIALGFAASFSLGGLLHLGSSSDLAALPWWKWWEFTCGFGGGMALFSTFWHVEGKGLVRELAGPAADSKPSSYLWGFWIPFVFAIAELGRDKLQQIGKIWKVTMQIDLGNAFVYAGYVFIAVVVLWFVARLVACHKEGQDLGSKNRLFITRPALLYMATTAGFFSLALFSWIRGPWDLVRYLIPLLTTSSMAVALVLFWLVIGRHMHKPPAQPA